MPIPTKGFNAPPSATGAPYPRPIVQVGDPGAVGPGTWWVNPLTGAESIRNAANTGWIATSGSGAIPNIGQVLTAGDDAGAKPITNLTDPTNPQDAATKAYVDGATPDLAAVLTAGDDAGGLAIGNLAALTVAVATIGPIADSASSLGTIGQIVTALGAGGSPADGWTWQDAAIPHARIGAGVPSGAPVAGENGMAAD